MTSKSPTVGTDGSLRLDHQRQRIVLSRQQFRILAILWRTAGKQLPSAGLYALIWQVPFGGPGRRSGLTHGQRASVAASVRRLSKVGLVTQPRPLWLALTPAGAQLMHMLTQGWAGWDDYRRRFLDTD